MSPDFLFSICDECQVYSVERSENQDWRKNVPQHTRHFIEKHLGHSIRFVFQDGHIDLVAPAYSISIGMGIFLTKVRDKKKYLKDLENGEVGRLTKTGDPRMEIPSLAELKIIFAPLHSTSETARLNKAKSVKEFFEILTDFTGSPQFTISERSVRTILLALPKSVLKMLYDTTRERHPDRVVNLHPLIKEAGGEGMAVLFG